jgi:hypothetical protein
MNLAFDRYLFEQIGLDSGSLTMLGSVIHSFGEPGEYRGSVHQESGNQFTFSVTADKDSPVAQVDIDLATLTTGPKSSDVSCCSDGSPARFILNAKGYVVFHASGGAGGYSIHLRRAVEDRNEPVFDSQRLADGDIFSAVIIRPGAYAIHNTLTKAQGEVTVAYPEIGSSAYRPPDPVRIVARDDSFEPRYVELKPGQGMLFECATPARIRIDLERADDGPGNNQVTGTRGWQKNALPTTAPDPGQARG